MVHEAVLNQYLEIFKIVVAVETTCLNFLDTNLEVANALKIHSHTLACAVRN
jgi:hypothetical protein